MCGAGYLSSQTQLVHFGLGDAERVEVLRVRWPSGRVQVFKDLPANRRLHIVEGKATLKEVQLNSPRLLSGMAMGPEMGPEIGPDHGSPRLSWVLMR